MDEKQIINEEQNVENDDKNNEGATINKEDENNDFEKNINNLNENNSEGVQEEESKNVEENKEEPKSTYTNTENSKPNQNIKEITKKEFDDMVAQRSKSSFWKGGFCGFCGLLLVELFAFSIANCNSYAIRILEPSDNNFSYCEENKNTATNDEDITYAYIDENGNTLEFKANNGENANNGDVYIWGEDNSSQIFENEEFKTKTNTLITALKELYYEGVTNEEIVEGIYSGIMDCVDDPYTEYYVEENFEEVLEETNGTFGGIGAYIQQDAKTNALIIANPMKNSPAFKAGVKSGDIILTVDGVDVTNMSSSEAIALIKGEPNTTVTLGIYRSEEEPNISITITRDIIQKDTLEYEMMDNGIGYIWIYQFDMITPEQFKNTLDELKSQGMKGLILDLRDNHGGELTSAVSIVDELLPSGNIVTIKDKNNEKVEYNATSDNRLDVPMVVLINDTTASASEIVAGALKDNKKAFVMGSQSYGKGIVQTVFSMGDGTGIKITTAKYFLPNGGCIDKLGITPDEVVEFDGKAYQTNGFDNQKDAAYKKVLKMINGDK